MPVIPGFVPGIGQLQTASFLVLENVLRALAVDQGDPGAKEYSMSSRWFQHVWLATNLRILLLEDW